MIAMRSKISGNLNSRMRICIIGNQANSLLNFRGSLVADMTKIGHDIFTLAPDFDKDTQAGARALGAKPIEFSLSRTGMNPVRDAADMLRLAFLLRRLKPDVTLSYAIKPVIYGTLASRFAQVPERFAMIEGLGYCYMPSQNAHSLKRLSLRIGVSVLYALALRYANLVFFLNRDDIDEFTNKRIIPPSKAFLLGGIGVDLDYWRFEPPVKKPVTFLLAARLLREKGIAEYAKAAKIIKEKYPDTRFILIGGLDTNPGGLSPAEIEAWTAEGILEWPGYVPDVRHWMAKTSVFILPSYYREGVPRSIQEAMAMGRPVITTDSPGCRETVVEGKNGFLVPVRDINALEIAMEKFILHPELIKSMGQISRCMAEENFDASKVNQIILRKMGIS